MMVGSFNVRNSYLNNYERIRNDGVLNTEIVSKIIKTMDFDLLGTQEMTYSYTNDIARRLSEYRFCGDYRYGDMLKLLPFNENNNIISRFGVLIDKTIGLPWLPGNLADLSKAIMSFSMMPRIATIVVTMDNDYGLICMINTHLDYKIPRIQLRQLYALRQLVNKYSHEFPVILTGDFNMEPDNSLFQEFTYSIGNDGIVRIDIDDKTWHNPDGEDKTLDHIFVSNCFSVNDAGVIDSGLTSDHDIIYAKIKMK